MTLDDSSRTEHVSLEIAKSKIETVAQAIVAFETIGMAARNLCQPSADTTPPSVGWAYSPDRRLSVLTRGSVGVARADAVNG